MTKVAALGLDGTRIPAKIGRDQLRRSWPSFGPGGRFLSERKLGRVLGTAKFALLGMEGTKCPHVAAVGLDGHPYPSENSAITKL